jgi:hypothetical protein
VVVGAAFGLAGCGGGSKTVIVTVPAKTSTAATPPAATTSTTASVPTTTSTAQTTTPATPTTRTASTPTPPTVHLTEFQSPSGNIGCIVVSGIARCDIKQRNWSPPPRPASCPNVVDFGQGLQVFRHGAGRVVCAGDTALNPTAKKLAYGTDSVAGPFRCASATAGITCTNTATGHGFFISIQSYRLF